MQDQFPNWNDSAMANEDFGLDSMVCDFNLRLIPNQKDGEEEIYIRMPLLFFCHKIQVEESHWRRQSHSFRRSGF
ncbi:hypothetical protein SLA2020_187720 [Shorea laevis]